MADENDEQSVDTVLNKPDAGPLTGDEYFYLIQGTGSDRDKKLKLAVLAAYLIGGGVDEIEAKKIIVGASEWVRGNGQPTISGLYALVAGNVETANLQVDSIGPKTVNSRIEMTSVLVGSLLDVNAKLKLGPTNIMGKCQVNDDTEILGTLKANAVDTSYLTFEVSDYASVAAAETAIADMANNRIFYLVNTSNSTQEFHFSGGAVINITAYRGVAGIKKGGHAYPLNV